MSARSPPPSAARPPPSSATTPAGALALLERARDAGLGSLVVLVGRDPAQLVAQIPVVSKEELLASSVPAVTPEGFGYDPARGELWFAGETAEALLLELQARRRSLASELDGLRARLETPIPDAAYSLERNPFAERSARLAERLLRALEVSVDHLEAPLRTAVDAGAARNGELGAELRRLGAAEVELRQELAAASEAVSALEVEAARLGAEADEARRRLEQANADEPAEGDDRDAARSRRSSGSSAVARRSARSTRSRTRSTRRRRNGWRSSPPSGPTSRRASRSSRSFETS